MNSQTSCSRAELEFAEVALRAVLASELAKVGKADATSLQRMLHHIVNMNLAISTSPERHANVAKRLGDFAVATARMARRNPDAAARLTRLSDVLRTAGSRLHEGILSDVNLPGTEVIHVDVEPQHDKHQPGIQSGDAQHHRAARNPGDGRVLEKLVQRVHQPRVTV